MMMMMESSNKINITSTISTSINSPHDHHYEDEEIKVPLPGFRFYPTDEELIGFYLRRKVHNKLLNIQFIQQIDIYKYDPWDIPKGSSSSSTSTRGGNNEWYFFCKRGRKYKNSIRPNRVTGSGFWKATGIDKPVHSTTVAKSSDHHHQYHDNCIGLKKTLVYYRGSAGKGIKTDWMMHEFRLPDHNSNHILHSNTLINHQPQEAEIWTLCRILKRNVAYKKFTTDSRELPAKRHLADRHRASKKCNFKNNMVESNINISQEAYIDFSAPMMISQLKNDDDKKPAATYLDHMINHHQQYNNNNLNQFIIKNSFKSTHPILSGDSISTCSYDIPQDDYDFFTYGDINWDELGSVVDFALNNDDQL